MDIKYVIPSYKRCDKLKDLTLEFLIDQDIDLQDVYVFLRNDNRS